MADELGDAHEEEGVDVVGDLDGRHELGHQEARARQGSPQPGFANGVDACNAPKMERLNSLQLLQLHSQPFVLYQTSSYINPYVS